MVYANLKFDPSSTSYCRVPNTGWDKSATPSVCDLGLGSSIAATITVPSTLSLSKDKTVNSENTEATAGSSLKEKLNGAIPSGFNSHRLPSQVNQSIRQVSGVRPEANSILASNETPRIQAFLQVSREQLEANSISVSNEALGNQAILHGDTGDRVRLVVKRNLEVKRRVVVKYISVQPSVAIKRPLPQDKQEVNSKTAKLNAIPGSSTSPHTIHLIVPGTAGVSACRVISLSVQNPVFSVQQGNGLRMIPVAPSAVGAQLRILEQSAQTLTVSVQPDLRELHYNSNPQFK